MAFLSFFSLVFSSNSVLEIDFLQGCVLDCAELIEVVAKKGSWYNYGEHRSVHFVVSLNIGTPKKLTEHLIMKLHISTEIFAYFCHDNSKVWKFSTCCSKSVRRKLLRRIYIPHT